MSTDLDRHKDAFIRQKIGELQAEDPKRSFVDCWNQLAREHSDWMESEPADDDGPDGRAKQSDMAHPVATLEEVGELRQPHQSRTRGFQKPTPNSDRMYGPVSGAGRQHLQPVATRAGKLDVAAIARRLNIPVTVYATAAGEFFDASPAHARLLCEYMETLGYRGGAVSDELGERVYGVATPLP
jgi:hypothetical protein